MELYSCLLLLPLPSWAHTGIPAVKQIHKAASVAERDSAEGCGVRKKYVVASVVHMREQRRVRETAVLPVGEDWGRRVGV